MFIVRKIFKDSPFVYKDKYPKGIYLLLASLFLRMISISGRTSIIIFYMISELNYSEEEAILIFHGFIMATYFLSILGGILADTYLGKFKTVLYFMPFLCMAEILSLSSSFPEPYCFQTALTYSSLVEFTIASAVILPSLATFGAEQFILPYQHKHMDRFFSISYVIINVASVFGRFLFPMMRTVKCFTYTNCFALPNGVSAFLLIASYIIFVNGYPFYRILHPGGLFICKILHMIPYAIVKRAKTTRDDRHKGNHWLEYAHEKYSKQEVEETRHLLILCLLFSPTIFFWALYYQVDSKWAVQASQMDGRVGSAVILPDQMGIVNPILMLILVPMFDYVFYPFFETLNCIRTPLQKMAWGGFIAAFSFVITGLVQLKIQSHAPVLPGPGQAQLRIYNTAPFDVFIGPEPSIRVKPLSSYENLKFKLKHADVTNKVHVTSLNHGNTTTYIKLHEKKASFYLISWREATQKFTMQELALEVSKALEKHVYANPKMKIIYSIEEPAVVKLKSETNGDIFYQFKLNPEEHQTKWDDDLLIDKYEVIIYYSNGHEVMNARAELAPGGVYILMISKLANLWETRYFVVTPPNKVHVLWQVPQHIFMAIAEIMFSITASIFSYKEAPRHMRALVAAVRLWTIGLGNGLVLFTAVKLINNEAYMMFAYAGMMVVVMIIFVLIAVKYKYSHYAEVADTAEGIGDDEPT